MAAAAGIGQGPPQMVPALSQARIILGSASSSRRGELAAMLTATVQTPWHLTDLREQTRSAYERWLPSKIKSSNPCKQQQFAGIMDELAKEHGFSYEVCTADIDEKAIRESDPKHLVIRLAHAKAEAIRAKLLLAGTITGLLLTCDQVRNGCSLWLGCARHLKARCIFRPGRVHCAAVTTVPRQV